MSILVKIAKGGPLILIYLFTELNIIFFFNHRFWFSEVRNLEKNRPFYLYILHAERKNSVVVLSKPKNCPLTWVFRTSLKKFFSKRVHGCCHVHVAVMQKLDLQKRLKEISTMHLVAERLILHFSCSRNCNMKII